MCLIYPVSDHATCLSSRITPVPGFVKYNLQTNFEIRVVASFMDTLKNKLRVGAAPANECAAKLTQHAVHYVEKFYLHRFATMGKHGMSASLPQPHYPAT